MRITIVQRTHDWIAYDSQNPNHWEAGSTEAEAIGKLVLSHPELIKEV